jgi:hypothetical protein
LVLDIRQDSDQNDGRDMKGQHGQAASMNEQAVGSCGGAKSRRFAPRSQVSEGRLSEDPAGGGMAEFGGDEMTDTA